MKTNQIYFLFTVLVLFFSSACEDVIEVDPGFESSSFVVDAWINNMDTAQVIRLTQSQNYFQSSRAEGVSGASVVVTRDDGTDLIFTDQGDGQYVYDTGLPIGDFGDVFTLEIQVNEKIYSATSTMNPVPEIDSISIEDRVDELGFDDGKYASLFVRDLEGFGSTYWAKTWKNDTLLNKPQELALIYDAAFDAGTDLDGTYWIAPLREFINPIPDDDDDTNSFQVPYVSGDRIYCEVHAINNNSFEFLQTAFEQITNGDNGIFTIPVANTRSNVRSSDAEETVLGMFDVAAVSTIHYVVD